MSSLSRSRGSRTDKQTFGIATPPCVYKDLESPKRRTCSIYTGLNNGDSPGEGEVSQDIVWDSMSPPPSHNGKGPRNTAVKISDIVNRIAPEDAKPSGVESPLLQWIGASTPEIHQPRVRKKTHRRSKVENLLKLARQFDKNMQQDNETSEQRNAVDDNLPEHGNTTETRRSEMSFPGHAKELTSPSSPSNQEAELRALFDCSTQRVSGPLSESSITSSCSQERKGRLERSAVAEPPPSEFKSASAHPAKDEGSLGAGVNKCDEFDDDWEMDDLLNVLAMTQSSEQHDAESKTTTQLNTGLNMTQHVDGRSACPTLQELCPQPKTSTRRTFRLEPNPQFHAKTAAAKDVSRTGLTTSHTIDQKSATTKPASSTTVTTPQSDRVTSDRVTSDRVTSNRVTSGRVTSNRVTSDRVTSNRVTSDWITSDRVTSDRVTSDRVTSDRITSGRVTSGGVTSDRITSDRITSGRVTSDQIMSDRVVQGSAAGEHSGKDVSCRDTKTQFDSDCLWDDGDDDKLLYQLCDDIERISNSQEQQRQDVVEDGSRKTSAPLSIVTAAWSIKSAAATRQSHGAFVRSNSLPGTSSDSVNYQGWHVPMKGASSRSLMSQSQPGSRGVLGGSSHAGDTQLNLQPRTVTTRPPQNSKSHHASFKRNLSGTVADGSAAISNKVFVTGQMTGKCSAAEIQRKKQEALARRRLRMQNTPKP